MTSKLILPKTVFLSVVLLLCILCTNLGLAGDEKVIAVVTSQKSSVYDVTLNGFTKSLKASDISVDIKNFDLKDAGLFEKLVALKPDLILTIGTSATKNISKQIQDIPIIFSAVLGPVRSGLDGKNLTGSLLNIPVKAQFEAFKKLYPKLQKIGVLYNPKLNQNLITEAKDIAAGMNLELVSKPVKHIKEIGPALKEILPKIDGFWFIADNIVCQTLNVKHILLESLKMSIPVMGISPAFVKTGTLLALTCDYEDIGNQSGEMALSVLQGKHPSEIEVSVPRITKLYLNLKIAKRLGISVSDDIVKTAAEVYGQ